jgi:ABC-2 type transport system permease protein
VVDSEQPKHRIPGSVAQTWTIAKNEFENYTRSRRFYILLGVTALISLILTVVVGYYRPPEVISDDLTFYRTWWGMFASFVIILSGIFFGGDAISGEFQNKTGYFLIPNPLRRSSIYVGKWISALAASIVMIVLFGAIAMVNGIYYFGAAVPWQFGYSVAFALFYLAAVLGFTFFFSSLFKSSSISILITTILFLFVFGLVETLVSTFVKIEPWFILTYGSSIIANVLTTTYPPAVQTIQAGPRFSITTYNATIPEGLAIIAAYFVITAIIGLILFERKEFTT